MKADSGHEGDSCCDLMANFVINDYVITNKGGDLIACIFQQNKDGKINKFILRYCPFCGAKITKEWEDEDA